MEKTRNEKKTLMVVIGILVLIALVIGIAYAFLTINLEGSKTNVIKIGSLDIILDESTSEGINITNGVAIPDEEGLALTPFTFSIKNNASQAIDYVVYLDDTTLLSGETKVSDIYLKYSLDKGAVVGTATPLTSTGVNPNRVLDKSTISGNETIKYALRLWFNSAVDGDYSNQTFRAKLRVVATQSVK